MNTPDPELLNIFEAEQAEHVERMRNAIRRLPSVDSATLPELFEEVLRPAHTLKGAARAVGLDDTEAVVHELETAVLVLRGRDGTPSAEQAAILQDSLDFVEDVLGAALGRRGKPDVRTMLKALRSSTGAGPIGARLQAEPVAIPVETSIPDHLVRVDAGVLDAMVRVSSQLANRTDSMAAASGLVEEHARLTDEFVREYQRRRSEAASYVRKHRADPAFAAVAECLNFLDRRQPALQASARIAAAVQKRHTWELKQEIEDLKESTGHARMVPAESAFGAFGSMVRALADQTGKQVVFRAEGLDVRADRVILQGLKDSVMHLLRNAISHGIRTPEERISEGLPAAGSIQLLVQSRGDRLNISVENDGAGLNLKALADQAIAGGFVTVERVSVMSADEISALIFHPGLSTERSASSLSGRGIGLSIVRDAVKRLRGTVRVRPRRGGGVAVQISAPLSVSSQQVLMVLAGEDTFAIPAAYVEAVGRWRATDIVTVNGQECVEFESQVIPIVGLRELLQLKSGGEGRAPGSSFQAMVVNEAGTVLAIGVTSILEHRDALVRETGLSDLAAGWSAGAIPLEDGSAGVLLNLAEPIRNFLEAPRAAAQSYKPEKRKQKQRVLVVDDSITTRSLERSILEANGFEVELAVDGMDGLEKLRARRPDLVISDVAMPRMSGFELLKNIKSDKATAGIPVILVTSLESPEEQQQGLSLGADAYIVKRKFDQRDLLATVRQIL